MLSVNGYKWMLVADRRRLLYVDSALRQRCWPNVIGGAAITDWRDHENLHHGVPEFSTKAEKYEGGMLAFGPLYGMGASIEMMLEMGPERIEQRVMELARMTTAALRAAGGGVVHCESPIVTARFERSAEDLVASPGAAHCGRRAAWEFARVAAVL